MYGAGARETRSEGIIYFWLLLILIARVYLCLALRRGCESTSYFGLRDGLTARDWNHARVASDRYKIYICIIGYRLISDKINQSEKAIREERVKDCWQRGDNGIGSRQLPPGSHTIGGRTMEGIVARPRG